MIYKFNCLILIFPTVFCIDGFMDNYHTEFQNIDYCLTGSESDYEDSLISTSVTLKSTKPMTTTPVDPIVQADMIFNKLLFGKEEQRVTIYNLVDHESDPMVHYPDGAILSKSYYGKKKTARLPDLEYIYPGHCRLKLTNDYMQTALNAFAILAYGTVEDIYKLPRNYIMVSARTIAMIKICNEKLAAVWKVFKGDLPTENITYEMLQLYRPLFRYVSAREMAKLNLKDDNIVSFIGTHPQLNRHQVAIIAKRYIQMNPKWATPRYMNIMNNLLCGIPMSLMRSIDDSYFLRISYQVFYHIHACDPLQRRFYLIKMTKTTVLGKAYSWSARDVSKLGLLLAEVCGPDLSTINPASMVAISAQVMTKMLPENLRYITESQLKFIQKKPLNILSQKLSKFRKTDAHATTILVNLILLVTCISISFYCYNSYK